jgi:hypothetical protein
MVRGSKSQASVFLKGGFKNSNAFSIMKLACLILCIYCMKTFQTSFFDESKRLAALSRLSPPLEELHKHIDFNIFRPIRRGSHD